MTLLALSDEVQLAIIGAIVAITGSVSTIVTAYLAHRAVTKETAPVKATLEQQNQVLEEQNRTRTEHKAETDEKLTEIKEATEGLKVDQQQLVEKVAKIETNIPIPPSQTKHGRH